MERSRSRPVPTSYMRLQRLTGLECSDAQRLGHPVGGHGLGPISSRGAPASGVSDGVRRHGSKAHDAAGRNGLVLSSPRARAARTAARTAGQQLHHRRGQPDHHHPERIPTCSAQPAGRSATVTPLQCHGHRPVQRSEALPSAARYRSSGRTASTTTTALPVGTLDHRGLPPSSAQALGVDQLHGLVLPTPITTTTTLNVPNPASPQPAGTSVSLSAYGGCSIATGTVQFELSGSAIGNRGDRILGGSASTTLPVGADSLDGGVHAVCGLQLRHLDQLAGVVHGHCHHADRHNLERPDPGQPAICWRLGLAHRHGDPSRSSSMSSEARFPFRGGIASTATHGRSAPTRSPAVLPPSAGSNFGMFAPARGV